MADPTTTNDDAAPAPGVDRRWFLAAGGATAGALALGGLAACSDDGSDGAKATTTTTTTAAAAAGSGTIRTADVPDQDQIYGWIEKIVEQGVRRPGYDADTWAEGWIEDRFQAIGLDHVRTEPVTVLRWEPSAWSLTATPATGAARQITGFPVPFAAPTDGLELELAAFDPAAPEGVDGKAALVDSPLISIPAGLLATAGSAPKDPTGRTIDPDGTLEGATHLVPFSTSFTEVMEPAIAGGAAAFIGSLVDYPGDSCRYFVPYDGKERPIPGLWISGSDGAWLHEQLATGPVQVKVAVESTAKEHTSHNIIGELPGADDQTVMIGSHHDGPWASAVEDASGTSLVLAQAADRAAQPRAACPHRLLFILQGGHMSGGAGMLAYIEAHRDELADVVLEVHLEHAALEFAEIDGKVAPTGRPVPRWWFTSRIPPLEAAVSAALTAEGVNRSMLLAPDAFGTQPPTDGAFYHSEGVPIVQFLEAPFYLFDEMDTLDKIDQEHLVPITRAVIRIIDSTAGTSAQAIRAAEVKPSAG